jgi:hypothetical protein
MAPTATLWLEPSDSKLRTVEVEDQVDAGHPASRDAAAVLIRRAIPLPPALVRPFFVTCALEGWRRVPAERLAAWSNIQPTVLRRRLAAAGLTPGGVAAWNLALHAAWLLDVASLPVRTVVSSMRLGRAGALGAVLGARGVRFVAGRIEPGAFAATLDRYAAMLRAAFPT